MGNRSAIRLAMIGACASCLFPSPDQLGIGDASADAMGDAADAFVGDAAIESGVPTFVQVSSAEIRDASAGVVVFDAAVTSGDTILVGVDYAPAAGTLKVTDAMNNTYVVAYALPTQFLFAAYDVQGGVDPVTINLVGGPTTEFEVYVHEYANISALDSANGATGTADAMASGTVTTSVANELLFGYVTINYGARSPGAGFTERSSFNGNVTEDRLVPTPGSVVATATKDNGTNWAMIGAAFKGH